MKTQALKGMRDLLPAEQTLRDYIQGKILETYRASGFERISTPMLEDMENLDKSDGGDNLNLIFKVLKRGDKLTAALNTGDPKQLSDMGLRYDLTLPLSRYYAANKDKLPSPFKVIQTDRVFRAERPQKGRLREFVQCDIDILGDSSPNAEVELIDVTARALLERFTSDHAKNFVNYNNPDYDALFTQALNASDDTQQAEIYKQMETMLSDTAANLYIQDLADLVAMRQNLAGLEFYPIYVLDLSTVHFVK